ncbi:MAG: TrbG/VirB9 family P-type conjugative transfer protein [Pseudomonadota bacterium]
MKLATLIVSLVAVLAGQGAYAADQFNRLEDAATSQAKRWQSGYKAKPIMSSDGKIIFPFGQSMPQLTCSPMRSCDVEMEPGEKVKTVVLADGVNWKWLGAESVEQGKTIAHVVFQPVDKELESNAIIYTDRRSYHIKLYSPSTEGAYLNRVGFYYPESLVNSWEEKMGKATAAVAKEEAQQVMPASASPEKMAYDYRFEGDADFKPVRVFNDGERTFITLPESVKTGEHPTLSLVDEAGKQMVVLYRSRPLETGETLYTVDKLFNKAELHRDTEKVTIIWKRKEKGIWSAWGGK